MYTITEPPIRETLRRAGAVPVSPLEALGIVANEQSDRAVLLLRPDGDTVIVPESMTDLEQIVETGSFEVFKMRKALAWAMRDESNERD